MTKKINIAFIWHFHQPPYQESTDSDFLMPWTRLHATKDYLDMLLRIDNFKNIKLNFNMSPTLVDSIERYVNGAHDIHSRLLVSKIEELDNQDKGFILNNFFDANYNNLILSRKYYTSMYNKRYLEGDVTVDDFSEQEYSDIMANFTLLWFDNKYLQMYPELRILSEKEKGYTHADRLKIYDFTIQIMKQILPTFKKYQDEGKIEISASPYYHPILPLLLDMNEIPVNYKTNLPRNHEAMKTDAYNQVRKSLARFNEVFAKVPKGMWLSEQCISRKTLKMLSELDVKWTVTDIGILSKTLGKEFLRSFDGSIENPFDLCVNYKLKGKGTNVLFSDSFISNLVGFNYGAHSAKAAANDLYERIKTLQNRLQNSPCNEHLVTIAMDGENCWESYEKDGDEFLNILYGLIENDTTLQTVLVSDYIEKNKHPQKLDNIASGSWINRNFDLWIGESVKNIAWSYVNSVREDAGRFIRKSKDEELNKKIMEEIYIAQGSDWFWWYGEPNDSGRDHIFDHLFRTHLKNAYKLMGVKYPCGLDVPLISIVGKPIRNPRNNITPEVSGVLSDDNEAKWFDAGCIMLPDNPTSSGNKIIKSFYFGHDKNNIYLRFDLNKANIDSPSALLLNELYICFKNDRAQFQAPIRLTNKTENVVPVIKNFFTHEIKLLFDKNSIYPSRFSQAIQNGLWSLRAPRGIKYAYSDIIELAVSFDDLDIEEGSSVELCAMSAHNGIVDEIFPQDVMINLTKK